MTKIRYQTGDLLKSPYPLILHGCNACGGMGSGIAKAIRQKYPVAFEKYKEHHRTQGLKLGEVIFVDCGGRVVANGITQQDYGRDGKRYVSYDAINTVMGTVNMYAALYRYNHVAMPLIGAGLGGGSWSKISEIIEKNFVDAIPVVYTLDGHIPN